MRKKIIVSVLAIATLAFMAISCRKIEKSDGVKIGVILSLSENGASYGKRALNGFVIAQAELNNREFFRKRKLELVVEDTKTSASHAVMAFEKEVNVDKVPVVVGMVMSDEVLACAKLANQKKIVILTTGAGSTKITDAGPFIFRNRESATIQADTMAKACVSMNKPRVAIVYSHAANGISYKDAFKAALLKRGGSAVVEIGYNEGLDDYRAEIRKVMNLRPDAIYLAGVDREIGLILKQAAELKNAIPFFASAGAVTPKLLQIAGVSAEGLISVSEAFDPTDASIRDSNFVKAYVKEFQEEPEWVAANAYEGLMLIGQLVESGCVTGDEFRKVLETVKFPSFAGTISFDANGDVIKQSRLLRVQNGAFQRVD